MTYGAVFLLGILLTVLLIYIAPYISFPSPFASRRYLADLRRLLHEMPFIFRDISLTVLQDYVQLEYDRLDLASFEPRTQASHHLTPPEDALQVNKRVLILGAPGVGKTTFQRYSILSIIKNYGRASFLYPSEKCLPIFVPLKAVDNSQPAPIIRYLTTNIPIFSGSRGRKRLEVLAKNSQLLLCLDGYDEISFSGATQNFVRDELNSMLLANESAVLSRNISSSGVGSLYSALAGCRIWIASRKEFFFHNPIDAIVSKFETSKAKVLAIQFRGVGNNRMRLVSNIFSKYNLSSTNQSLFLDPEYFLGQIDSAPERELVDLSDNPLFLTVMCYIYAKRVLETGSFEVPWVDKMDKLINVCVDLLLHDLDKEKARDLPEARRVALLKRRNAYLEEKRLFLTYFSAQLIFKQVPLFTFEMLKEEVKKFFEVDCRTNNSASIIAELSRDNLANPNFALQMIYCGVFIVAAVQGRTNLYDFPHRRFREVLAVRYIDTPEKYLELLTHSGSTGLSEFMQVFKKSEQYNNAQFHEDTFRLVLQGSKTQLDTDFFVRSTDGLVREAFSGSNIAAAFETFLMQALTDEQPRFRISARLLELCRATPDIRARAEACCEEGMERRDPNKLLLGWKVIYHLERSAAEALWTKAKEQCLKDSRVTPAWVSFGIDLGRQIGENVLSLLSASPEIRDECLFPIALKWPLLTTQLQFVRMINELPLEERHRLLVRRRFLANVDINPDADPTDARGTIKCKLKTFIIDAARDLSSGKGHASASVPKHSPIYFFSSGAFTWLLELLRKSQKRGLRLGQTVAKATQEVGSSKITIEKRSLLEIDKCRDLRNVIQGYIDQLRERLLAEDEFERLCKKGIYQSLVDTINAQEFETGFAEPDIYVSDLLDKVRREFKEAQWKYAEWQGLKELVAAEQKRKATWCEFFEEADGWNRLRQEQTVKSIEATERRSVEDLGPKEEEEVFVSYAWTSESNQLIDQLELRLRGGNVRLHRDRTALHYKDSIRNFMRRLGRGKCIVVILSKRYLESPSCMFELLEIQKKGEFRERVFPVVLKDANIYTPLGRLGYIKYWEEQKQKLDRELRGVSGEKTSSIREDLDLYAEIRGMLDSITDTLRDMNALTVEEHLSSNFDELIREIEEQLSK